MPYSATVLNVMIACPGDGPKERLIAPTVVHEWNAVHGRDRGLVLLPLLWETQAARHADLLVAVFRTRIWTLAGATASGTVEEIEEHVRAGKPAMLYFSTAAVRAGSVAEDGELRGFRARCTAEGLVETYKTIAEFREKFSRQLTHTIIERFPWHEDVGAATSATAGGYLSPADRLLLAGVSPDARELLKAVSLDLNGTVLVLETAQGTIVDANGRNFVDPADRRSEARWRRAVQELLQAGLLEQRDRKGQTLNFTAEGFRIADLLD
jgi:hypothetical protein